MRITVVKNCTANLDLFVPLYKFSPMKAYIIILSAIVLVITGCKPVSQVAAQNSDKTSAKTDAVKIANEDLGYEIIIIDPGFTGWLTRAQPRGYYEQTYLEIKNRMWVLEWNNRFLQADRYRGMYDMRIEYDQQVNYGYEVNYLLYNYLVYFQNKTGQRLGGNVPAF